MTSTRSLLIAVVAVATLIGVRPIASVEQFPRGLMSATPTAPGGNSRACSIETRPLSFGIYDPLAGVSVDAIAQIIYTCAQGGGSNPNDPGNGGGGGNNAIRIEITQGFVNSFQPRGMQSPGLHGEYLDYNIYLDATHRTVWGTGEGSTQAYIDSHPPNNRTVIVPAFGRIFASQDEPAGSYYDEVQVTIVF